MIFKHFVSFVKTFPEAIIPTRREDGSFDLYSPKTVEFEPGERKVINVGIIVEYPNYLHLFIRDKPSTTDEKCISVCGVYYNYKNSIFINIQNCTSTKIVISENSVISQIVFGMTVHSQKIRKEIREKINFNSENFSCDHVWYLPKEI